MAGEHRIGTAHDDDRDHGVLLLPVRKDDLSKLVNEPDGKTPYGDGKFAALEVDERGYLRVKLPSDGTAISAAPTVEELLTEQNSLLRRLVLAMEMIHGNKIPDPL